jgi:hypothetical protein
MLTTFLFKKTEKMERLSDAILHPCITDNPPAGLFTMRPMIIHGTVGGSRQKAQVSLDIGVYATIKNYDLYPSLHDYCSTKFSSSGVNNPFMNV